MHPPSGDGKMQSQARDAGNLPGIDADIIDYVKRCPICTNTKASLLAQPMLHQDIPHGPWQEIAADYFNHKADYLICNLFSRYPFLYKVTSKSALCLSQKLQELIPQYGPPIRIYTDNGHPFVSEDFKQFLEHQHINHTTSSPFPCSNGCIWQQVKLLKTTLSTINIQVSPLPLPKAPKN